MAQADACANDGAKAMFSAGIQTVYNVLDPLDAGRGSTTTGNRIAMKRAEISELQRTAISAVLFYFLSGNQLEIKNPLKDLQNENRAKGDNTLIKH